MKLRTEPTEFRHNLIDPSLLVPIHKVGLDLVVVLLHQTGMYKTQHLQVHLNLDELVLYDPTEQAVRTIFNFNQNSGTILSLLDPINFSTNYKLVLANLAHVQIIK